MWPHRTAVHVGSRAFLTRAGGHLQKQMKRVAIFTDFTRKKAAVLFATDIASRGLDFPSVDWVFQLDCPESVET